MSFLLLQRNRCKGIPENYVNFRSKQNARAYEFVNIFVQLDMLLAELNLMEADSSNFKIRHSAYKTELRLRNANVKLYDNEMGKLS